MAEAVPEKAPNSSDAESKEKAASLDCAVCLQTCIHPAKLPCGHVFCFLCIKGIANRSNKCAMCRQEIPREFVEHPVLLPVAASEEVLQGFDDGYQWFYEGRNGWWQYDERTSKELESCYKSGEKTCELLIAGFLYVIDLDAMLQLRRNDPSRWRRIKRDLANIPKKGVAGLRTEGAPLSYIEISDGSEAAEVESSGSNDDDELSVALDRLNSLSLGDEGSVNKVNEAGN